MSVRGTAGPSVLAVTNRKGGTGKTTTAVNLAAAFAAAGRRTLLIDLDTQGHCALGLGLRPAPGPFSAHHLFADSAPALAELCCPTAWDGLDLVPASTELRLARHNDDDQILTRALAEPAIAARYDQIILDSPPSLDHLLFNALAAAHWAIIPFLPHPLAGEGVKQLSRVFFQIALRNNTDLRLLGVLPVMLDARIGQHRLIRAQVAEQFGEQRVLGGIRNDIKLAEAFAAGQPVRVYAPRSRGHQDYQALFGTVETCLHERSGSR
ncbi:MAG: AAA family ATPase [Gammaproteobacteria bacterium]|jgi:chromosome partitioning protein|nr:AAA family ATPase [Gammaproteobacteria bacterium]